MVTEYLAYLEALSVDGVRRDIQANAGSYSDYEVQYAYVIKDSGQLVGVVPLRDLLLAAGGRRMGDLMIPNPLTVRDTATIDDMLSVFEAHSFIAVPVEDASGHLVGVVKRASVQEAVADRTGSDFLKTQGIVGGEELRTMPLTLRSRRRLSWLSVNILLNMIAASVIALYQDTIAAVIALAVFLPVISDMSGCSGNQAVAVSMRELSLGFVRPTETLRVWVKEVTLGAINGIVLGVLIGIVAWLWKGNVFLGLVVAIALAINTMIAVSIGGTVPLVMRRLGMDPALASGPILTTVTDMCGFFLLLSLASAFLPRLVGG
jgi:magnesium transporter